MLFSSEVKKDMARGFQMRYYASPKFKGLKNCDLSKFGVKEKKLQIADEKVKLT